MSRRFRLATMLIALTTTQLTAHEPAGRPPEQAAQRVAIGSPTAPASVGEPMSTAHEPSDPVGGVADALTTTALSFGSSAILSTCWTAPELAGRPTDQRIQKQGSPGLSGPPADAVQAAALALPPVPPERRGSIRSVEPADPEARLLALTFDLCESANERTGYQADLVDLLRRERVPATFFAGGKWMHSHPEQTMQLMADPLFEIGNHAWTHGNLRVLRGEEMRDQILWTQAEYHLLRDQLAARQCAHAAGSEALARIPPYPTSFRFPFGTCRDESLAAVADAGLAAIQWSIVTGDPARAQTAEHIVQAVLTGASGQRGAIVIAHANGRGWHTTEALEQLIPMLRERGYRFVRVSELLAAGEPQVAQTCYELQPGDNARYDTLFGRGTGEGPR